MLFHLANSCGEFAQRAAHVSRAKAHRISASLQQKQGEISPLSKGSFWYVDRNGAKTSKESTFCAMKPTLASDHHSASVELYGIVAFNTRNKSGYTINRNEAAKVLADLLQIDSSAPRFWLRGDFRKHPLSSQNFLKIVRAYRTKRGLESPKKITALAVDLYGPGYEKAVEILDPADREVESENASFLKKKALANAIFQVIYSSPSEEVKEAMMQLMGQRFVDDLGRDQKTEAL